MLLRVVKCYYKPRLRAEGGYVHVVLVFGVYFCTGSGSLARVTFPVPLRSYAFVLFYQLEFAI